jgi:murein L,D-transpeptidase YcbB/YkuD
MRRAVFSLIATFLAVPLFASAQTAMVPVPVGATSSLPYAFPLPKASAEDIAQLQEALKILKVVQERVYQLGLLPRNPVPLPGVENPTSLKSALEELKRSVYSASYVQVPLTQIQDLLTGSTTPKTLTQVITESGCVAVPSSLQLGSSGADVSSLQEFLAKIPGLYPEGQVTGYYGALTQKAVQRLQAALGIEQSGAIGPLTRTTLRALTCRTAG